jgi:hypothetical protein
MKYLKLLVLVISLGLFSCGGESDEDSLVRKRIIQKIETNAMGMIKDVNLEKLEKVNDSTFKGSHSFFNPMVDKEVRVTRNYIFTSDLDSIVNDVDVKTEMKSEGEWVDMF